MGEHYPRPYPPQNRMIICGGCTEHWPCTAVYVSERAANERTLREARVEIARQIAVQGGLDKLEQARLAQISHELVHGKGRLRLVGSRDRVIVR